MTGIKAIAAGGYTSLWLRSDGALFGAGYSDGGALGQNVSVPWTTTTVQVMTGVAAISSGFLNILKTDGTVVTHTRYAFESRPVSAMAIGANEQFVKCDGRLWDLGPNAFGQVGDGTTVDPRYWPERVNPLTAASNIAAGGFQHTLAIDASGIPWSWGDNSLGQLGTGNQTSSLTPVHVSGLTGVAAMSGGGYDSMALKSDGTLWAWGAQPIGDGTNNLSTLPVQIMNGVAQPTLSTPPPPTAGPTSGNTAAGGSKSMRHGHSPCVGQPVNCATGEFWHTFADLSLPGRGLPLAFTRTYSSLAAPTNARLGYGWTQSYGMNLSTDSTGNVTIAEETGSSVVFMPVTGGAYQGSTGIQASLIKNADGSFTFNRWDQTHFTFSAAGQLLEEVDRNGYTSSLSYNAGLLSTVTDPAGRQLTFAYIGGLINVVTDSTGRSVGFQYDPSGNLQTATDVNGGATRFTYDTNHLLRTMTDPNGGVLTNVYDSVGRVTLQTDPMQRSTSFDYATPGQTKITDPNGNVTVEVFANNLLKSRTLGFGTPQAATWSYGYDPATFGEQSITDPNSHTVSNVWDGNGNLLTHRDGLDRPTTYTYDSLNDLLTVTDPLGVPTNNAYDAKGNLLSTSRTVTNNPTTQSAVSASSYSLLSSNGSTWTDMDTSKLQVQVTPSVNQSTLLSANADLFTDRSGNNQDLGIFVNVDSAVSDTLLAWKESGGGAGTFSPNAAYVQYLYAMTGGHTYVFKLKWKAGQSARGVTIYAGAGTGNSFPTRSATSLTAETFPASNTPIMANKADVSSLTGSDGATWQPIDASLSTGTLSPSSNSTELLGANADLFTDTSGYNQDIGIFVSVDGATPTLVAWKESGGFGGTFSPNAAYVKEIYPMTGGHTYNFSLYWKTNKNAPGVTIYAGAGSGNTFPTRSATSLLAETLAAGANPYSHASTSQATLKDSDGVTWQPMDAALDVTVSPPADTNALLNANADLWTDRSGYNQDIGIFVSDNGGTEQLLAWKESGGGGAYSPNAAMAQAVYPTSAGHTYVFKLKWKAGKPAQGVTIVAGAGASAPNSPNRLAVELTSRTATVTYQYTDPAHPGDVTLMTDPDQNLKPPLMQLPWHYGYDQYGDRNLVIDPGGNKTTYTFNADGWPLTRVSPNGYAIGPTTSYTTTYDYTDQRLGAPHINGFGDVGVTTDPLARKTTLTYDANRNLTDATDANLHKTHKVYDADNELTEVDRADSSKVLTGYDANGNVSSQTDGLSQPTAYLYDTLNHQKSVTDPLLRTTSYVLDAVGNLKTITDPQQQVTTNSYDAADELTTVTYSDGETPNVGPIHYDLDGQRQDITDGKTGTTTYAFDSLHRLTQQTNGAHSTVSYSYDLRGHATAITYPGQTRPVTRSYDDAGRLKTVTDWLGASGNTTTYNYDADSNLTSQVYPNGTTATFTPDRADQTNQIVDAKGSSQFLNLSYSRDDVGQVKSENSTGYGYNAINQLTTSGSSSYGYDAADNLTQLTNGTTQKYDVANQLGTAQALISLIGTTSGGDNGTSNTVTLTLPAGLKANDQILVSTTGLSSTSVTTPAGYTVVGTVTSGGTIPDQTAVFRKTAVGTETTVTLSYSQATAKSVVAAVYRGADPVAPIDAQSTGSATLATSVTAPAVTAALKGEELVMFEGAAGNAAPSAWTAPTGMQDEVHQSGNPLTAAAVSDQTLSAAGTTGSRTATFGVNANLTALMVALKPAVTTFAYDQRGNRTGITPAGGPTTALTYDQANRLTGYGTDATYAYNGDGLRVSKTVAGISEAFTYDTAEGLPLIIQDGATSYVTGAGGLPLEQISGSTAVYYHQDQLGSTRALTDQAGTTPPTRTESYDAYGNTAASTGTTTPLQYAGQYRDSESGLYYLRARYYDPSTAQFISRDPAVAMTRSPYGYVGDNPLNGTDPSGLCNQGDWGCILANIAQLPGAIAHDAADDPWSNLHNNITDPHPSAVVATVRNLSVVTAAWSDVERTLCGQGNVSFWDWAAIPLDLIPGSGFTAGRELEFGANLKVSPLGNWGAKTASGDARWAARLPHWHQRIFDDAGNVVPGGGLGWHRPWEP